MKKLFIIIFSTYCFWSCGSNENEIVNSEIVTRGTFIDPRDNREYQWIIIGKQTWMAENLAYLPEIGKQNTDSLDMPDYYVYGYSGNNIDEAKSTESYLQYGVLYNFFSAQTACPQGWHLPSDDEWKQLELALGMSVSHIDQIFPSVRGTDQGIQMKSASGWEMEGNGNNSSGFSALPGGFRFCNGNFWFSGRFGYWWSSTTEKDDSAWIRSLSSTSCTICRKSNLRHNGFSIRCVKDN
jgi:uncharacterized protein (TIGR02145 family)